MFILFPHNFYMTGLKKKNLYIVPNPIGCSGIFWYIMVASRTHGIMYSDGLYIIHNSASHCAVAHCIRSRPLWYFVCRTLVAHVIVTMFNSGPCTSDHWSMILIALWTAPPETSLVLVVAVLCYCAAAQWHFKNWLLIGQLRVASWFCTLL